MRRMRYWLEVRFVLKWNDGDIIHSVLLKNEETSGESVDIMAAAAADITKLKNKFLKENPGLEGSVAIEFSLKTGD